MSNLEDKALTRAQLNCYPYLPFPDTKAFLEAEKWVPFEDAQKELTDLKDNARRQVWDLTVQVNNLEAKIKAAKERR